MVYRYRWFKRGEGKRFIDTVGFKRGEGKRFIDTVDLNVEKVKGL
jgi:hypothetical protein